MVLGTYKNKIEINDKINNKIKFFVVSVVYFYSALTFFRLYFTIQYIHQKIIHTQQNKTQFTM